MGQYFMHGPGQNDTIGQPCYLSLCTSAFLLVGVSLCEYVLALSLCRLLHGQLSNIKAGNEPREEARSMQCDSQ